MTQPTAAPVGSAALPGRARNLSLALAAFAITFWAWNIIGPLAVRYADELDLDATQTSLLIATPVLVGSVGRILTGALTDRYGGRIMFTVLTAASAVPVLLVASPEPSARTRFSSSSASSWASPARRSRSASRSSTPGTRRPSAASRPVSSVRAWAAPHLSAFFTPRMVAWFGYVATHVIIAVALLIVAALVWILMRDSPQWKPNTDPVRPKLAAASRLAVTWQMAFLYAVTFGGFVAFLDVSAHVLEGGLSLRPGRCRRRTAGFAIAAVVARPVGGWLSDRIGPATVLCISLGGAAVMAVVIALQPPPELAAGTSFVLMAIALGLGTGAVFTWVAQRAPAERVGGVTGIVGAAGGLGGFFPPLVMGATYNPETHSYAIGLGLLCLTAIVALVFTILLARRQGARAA